MSKEDEYTKIKDWIEKGKDFNVTSQRDGCVTYSGGFTREYNGRKVSENRMHAENLCDSNKRFTTLEKTEGGKFLEQNKDYLESKFGEKVNELWATASERYAKEASGKVSCYVTGASEKGIFINHELPALLENKKVTHINEIPRETLLNEYQSGKSLTEIHQKVTHGIKQISWDGDKNQEAPNRIQSEEKKHTYEFEYKGKSYVVESSKELESLQFDKDSLVKLENLKNSNELEISYSKDNKSNENARNSLEVDKAKIQRQEQEQNLQQGR